MPLSIDRVETEMDVLPAGGQGAAGGGMPAATPSASRTELREMLRPVVLEILTEELQRLQRRHG